MKENNTLPTDYDLIERMVERQNMLRAYSHVVKNKGAAGVDGITVYELKALLQDCWSEVKEQLLNGNYKPKPVLRIEIPKSNGGVRQLGIPTVLDRLIQQALHQVLESIFDPTFSEFSFGFRRGRSAHHAIKQAKKFQSDGRDWVVDMDLAKFFDEVNHDLLIARVRRKVDDKRVIYLIRQYLRSGVVINRKVYKTTKGTPQGGPLSPLLSNIMLDDLDKELERRGHAFCRYADDCNIYVRSQRSGERVLESVTLFVEKKLKLKVNQSKSAVDRPSKRKFLGFSFFGGKNPRIKVAKESIAKIKKTLKQCFRRGKGRNLGRFVTEELNPVIRGWINYFSIVDTKKFAEELDGWIRRHLRKLIWRQWKRAWTRRKRLILAGLSEEWAVMGAFNGRGPWYNAGAYHMNIAFKKKFFDKIGLVSMLDKVVKC